MFSADPKFKSKQMIQILFMSFWNTFFSDVVSNKPTTVITGIISNLPVPFPAEKDTCAHQTQCPIQAGKQSVFTITLPVLKSYPHVSYGMLPVMDLQCCFNLQNVLKLTP